MSPYYKFEFIISWWLNCVYTRGYYSANGHGLVYLSKIKDWIEKNVSILGYFYYKESTAGWSCVIRMDTWSIEE